MKAFTLVRVTHFIGHRRTARQNGAQKCQGDRTDGYHIARLRPYTSERKVKTKSLLQNS